MHGGGGGFESQYLECLVSIPSPAEQPNFSAQMYLINAEHYIGQVVCVEY